MTYFLSSRVNIFILLCFMSYVLGFFIFMNGLLSPRVVNFEASTVDNLFNECPETIEPDLCALQNSAYQTLYSNHRKKVVIIIIDALRADFIPSIKNSHKFNSTMEYTENLLNNKKAISFIAQGFAPTVTLPRIKTLVTGTISNFLDIIINFNADKLTTDNVLKQANLHGLKSIFYGDDTWIKLFPDIFIRSEGTHSFYVSDFTEVDLNVSRHILSELKNEDWNIMILHFLGVDHIGHAFSPFSEHLPKKLKEMDEVIKLIYNDLRSKVSPSLIIVCGDHGMTATGSHGGITPDELLTPFIFIDTADHDRLPLKSLNIIHQVDFAPTLSAILGIPIPSSNFGNIIPCVLEIVGFSRKEIIFAAYYNFLQLSNIYKDVFSKAISNTDLVKKTTLSNLKWLKMANTSLNDTTYINILNLYSVLLNEMKSDLLNNISGYDELLMTVGILVMWISSAFLFYFLCHLIIDKNKIFKNCLQKILRFFRYFIPLIIIKNVYDKEYLKIIFFLLFVILIFIFYVIFELLKMAKKIYLIKNLDKVCLFLLILHAVSLFSSSYIEEEHQTWYFFIVTIVICLSTRNIYHFLNVLLKNDKSTSKQDLKYIWNKCSVGVYQMIAFLALHRIAQKWNQVGNKWQHLADISDWLNEKENEVFLIFLLAISQIVIIIYLRKLLSGVNHILFSSGIICIFLKKLEGTSAACFMTTFTTSMLIPWIVYALITIMIVLTCVQLYLHVFFSNTERVQHILVNFVSQWVLLIEIIGRAHNIPLISILFIQEFLLSKIVWTLSCDKISNAICYMIMAKTSFFYYGNSNSLSTIDVFTGYTGIQSYMPLVVGFLIICNTYSTLMLWFLMLAYRIIFYCNEDFKNITNRIRLTYLFLLDYTLLILSLYSIVMYLMRHHLFIHSVFFPKLIYEVCFVLCFSSICILVSFIHQKRV